MSEYRISDLDSPTENIDRKALLEVSQPDGSGGYLSKKYKYKELVSLTSKTLFVNADYGDNNTAEPYNYQKPYATLAAAKAAAQYGDTIIVQPGTYSSYAPINVDGVNWYFEVGSFVNVFSQPFIDDGGSSQSFRIRGYLKAEAFIYPQNFIKIEAKGSNIDIEFDSIYCGTSRSVARVKYGTLRLKGAYIASLYQYGIEMFDDAKVFVDVEEMYSVSTFASYSVVLIGQGGTGYNDIRIKKLTSNSNNVGVLTAYNTVVPLNFKGNITHAANTPSGSTVIHSYSSSSINFEGNVTTNSRFIVLTPSGTREHTVKILRSIINCTNSDLQIINWNQVGGASTYAILIIKDTDIRGLASSNPLASVIGLSYLQMINSRLSNGSGSTGVSVLDLGKSGSDAPKALFNGTGLISADTPSSKCISNIVGTGVDIQIYAAGLYSNVDKAAGVTVTVGALTYNNLIYIDPYI